MSPPPKRHRWKRTFSLRCWTRSCCWYGHRFHLAKHPDAYAQRWRTKCPGCRRHLSVDNYRSSGLESRAARCSCFGYCFSHRRGSLFCIHGKAGAAGFCYAGPGSAEAYYQSIGVHGCSAASAV